MLSLPGQDVNPRLVRVASASMPRYLDSSRSFLELLRFWVLYAATVVCFFRRSRESVGLPMEAFF
jgi:hypothetical protein